MRVLVKQQINWRQQQQQLEAAKYVLLLSSVPPKQRLFHIFGLASNGSKGTHSTDKWAPPIIINGSSIGTSFRSSSSTQTRTIMIMMMPPLLLLLMMMMIKNIDR